MYKYNSAVQSNDLSKLGISKINGVLSDQGGTRALVSDNMSECPYRR